MTATATWILKDRNTQKVLWSKEGMAPPEIVVDSETYKNVFRASFPDVKITWGAGAMDMHIVSPDAVYKVGSVWEFQTTETHYQPNGQAAKGETSEFGTNARIAGDPQEEAHRMLGSTGLPPGLKLEEGIPGLDQGGTVASHFKTPPMPDPYAALKTVKEPIKLTLDAEEYHERFPKEPIAPKSTSDTPEFTVMLRNFKTKLLKMDPAWGDRLERLPDFVRRHVHQDPEGILVNDDAPWVGVFTKGTVRTNTSMSYEPFLLNEGDVKTRTYVNWVKGFMHIEASLNSLKECDYEHLFRVALEMFEDATMLYLLETGWSVHDVEPQPWGTVLVDVSREMEARVQFLKSKDLEYGQPTRRQGVSGVITRLWDKIARYTNLKANPGLLPKFESMADSAKDLGGYSAILAGLLQECLEEQNPNSEWSTLAPAVEKA